jgi:hypothetical protein
MALPFYVLIKGNFVIVNAFWQNKHDWLYSPDGDSIRFIPDNLNHFRALYNVHNFIFPEKDVDHDGVQDRDGSVQLRFEGVDTPELHFEGHAQPLGVEARDALLQWMGFTNVKYDADPKYADRVIASTPAMIPGAILTMGIEKNGRVVSYVLLQNDVDALGANDGAYVHVDDVLLAKTLNWRLLEEGMAYYTLYTSTPYDHRVSLHNLASVAHGSNPPKGVWAVDKTSGFTLKDHSSIGPGGSLVLPKLFRRCTSYLNTVGKERFRGSLLEWICMNQYRPAEENDRVVISDKDEVVLSNLIEQCQDSIKFKSHPLDLMFVEKT